MIQRRCGAQEPQASVDTMPLSTALFLAERNPEWHGRHLVLEIAAVYWH